MLVLCRHALPGDRSRFRWKCLQRTNPCNLVAGTSRVARRRGRDRATPTGSSLAAPPLRIIVEGSGVSSIKQLYQSQGFLRSNQIAETHGGGN